VFVVRSDQFSDERIRCSVEFVHLFDAERERVSGRVDYREYVYHSTETLCQPYRVAERRGGGLATVGRNEDRIVHVGTETTSRYMKRGKRLPRFSVSRRRKAISARVVPAVMDRGERLSSVVERIQEHASVTAVYGDPIEHGRKTVVPVARVAYGFGGGYGSQAQEGTQAENEGGQGGEGSGMGGGVSASPSGVVEITEDETRFISFGDKRKLATVAGASFVFGYLLGRN